MNIFPMCCFLAFMCIFIFYVPDALEEYKETGKHGWKSMVCVFVFVLYFGAIGFCFW